MNRSLRKTARLNPCIQGLLVLVLLCLGLLFSCSRPDPCGGKERYCDGNVLYVCVGDQSGLLEFPCKAGETCSNGRCQQVTQPSLDGGGADASSLPDNGPQAGALCLSAPPQCADRNHRWVCTQERWERKPCPASKVCSSGQCQTEILCQPGQVRCKDNQTAEVCFQGQWEESSCGTGKRCESGSCNDIPVCQDKQLRCSEPYVRETCTNGRWERQRCAVSFYCLNGQCIPQDAPCQDGSKRCKDGGNLDTCKQGVWVSQPCQQGKKCEINQCVPLPGCTNGKRRCATAHAEDVCVQDQWQRQPCAPGEQCQVARCVLVTSGACSTACGQGQICQNSQCINWSTTYKAIPFMGKKTDRDPSQHADLNLKLRGWQLVQGEATSLQTYNSPADPDPPKLASMFAKKAFPGIINNYQMGAWDWSKNAKNGWINTTFWKVHLVGFRTQPGEILKLPSRNTEIYPGSYKALVLFMDDDSITFNFVREDSVANGFAVHVQGVNIAVDLRRLYTAHADRASGKLPALTSEQPFGTALGNEVKVSIRDRSLFMDPRSKKDWW
ncbi:MAG: hypothetical protein EP343_32960 [Deltaproteobacteria bacterium]|nr:MAG: hypothetical protein EP343_32960 [Deltaproteobacteria bacterium]